MMRSCIAISLLGFEIQLWAPLVIKAGLLSLLTRLPRLFLLLELFSSVGV